MVAMIIGGSNHPNAACAQDEATLRAALSQQFDGSSRQDLPPLFQVRPENYVPGDQHLLVGIREDRGVLWWSHPAAHESLISAGGMNPDEVMYRLDTSELDFPPKSELPLRTVLDAAAEFQRTGKRPQKNVTWVPEDDAWDAAPEHVRHAS